MAFPHLGFDPAPGDPAALTSAGKRVLDSAAVIREAADRLAEVTSSGWTGPAAEAFRSGLERLPADLTASADHHQRAGDAIVGFGSGLLDRQGRARALERRAADAAARRNSAVLALDGLARRTAPTGSPEFARLRADHAAARSRLDEIDGELRSYRQQAAALHAENGTAADRATAALTSATTELYETPNWLERTFRGAVDFVRAHADTLRTITGFMKVGAMLAGLVPALAPVALVLGGAALLIDAMTMGATGEGNWSGLALDAVSMLPTGRVIRAGSRFARASGSIGARLMRVHPTYRTSVADLGGDRTINALTDLGPREFAEYGGVFHLPSGRFLAVRQEREAYLAHVGGGWRTESSRGVPSHAEIETLLNRTTGAGPGENVAFDFRQIGPETNRWLEVQFRGAPHADAKNTVLDGISAVVGRQTREFDVGVGQRIREDPRVITPDELRGGWR